MKIVNKKTEPFNFPPDGIIVVTWSKSWLQTYFYCCYSERMHDGGTKNSDPNLQKTCHHIDDNSTFRHYHLSIWLNLLIIDGGCSFFIHHTCPSTFALLNPLRHTSTQFCTVAVKSLRWTSVPNTPSNKRNLITRICSILMHAASGVVIFVGLHLMDRQFLVPLQKCLIQPFILCLYKDPIRQLLLLYWRSFFNAWNGGS